jgi:outer membrane protein W
MNSIFKILSVIFFLCLSFIYAQNEYSTNISLNFNYTTTAQLYLQPFSSDQFLRTKSIELNNINSYSLEINHKIFEDIFLGLSAEYSKINYSNNNFNLSGERATSNDGFTFIPIELTIYYYLPFSTESFKFFMGGGGALYFGKFYRTLGDLTINSKMNKSSFGIHVAIGMDYFFYNNFSLKAQMRFRDPELEWKNEYSNNVVNYNGITYLLNSSTFFTKVNIDGITFSLGISYNF